MRSAVPSPSISPPRPHERTGKPPDVVAFHGEGGAGAVQVDGGGEAVAAVDDVGLPSVVAPGRGSAPSADNEVGCSVAVHLPPPPPRTNRKTPRRRRLPR